MDNYFVFLCFLCRCLLLLRFFALFLDDHKIATVYICVTIGIFDFFCGKFYNKIVFLMFSLSFSFFLFLSYLYPIEYSKPFIYSVHLENGAKKIINHKFHATDNNYLP